MNARPHCQSARLKQCGFTLAEMLLAAALAAVIAAVAIPSVTMLNGIAVDAAASEAGMALRFAQQEAMRLSEPTVVSFSDDNIIRIFRLAYGAKPPVENPSSPVLYPGTTTPYRVVLDRATFLASAVSVAPRFAFADGTVVKQLSFAGTGEPVWVVGPAAADVVALAPGSSGQIVVSAGAARRVINIDPVSGRVSSL